MSLLDRSEGERVRDYLIEEMAREGKRVLDIREGGKLRECWTEEKVGR
jgi:hypothetical protein